MVHSISLSSLSKKVKLSGVVTEDKMTGESYVTHLTVVEETMGAKQPELKQTDSQSTTQSKEQSVSCLHLCICEKKQRWRFLPDFFPLIRMEMPVKILILLSYWCKLLWLSLSVLWLGKISEKMKYCASSKLGDSQKTDCSGLRHTRLNCEEFCGCLCRGFGFRTVTTLIFRSYKSRFTAYL